MEERVSAHESPKPTVETFAYPAGKLPHLRLIARKMNKIGSDIHIHRIFRTPKDVREQGMKQVTLIDKSGQPLDDFIGIAQKNMILPLPQSSSDRGMLSLALDLEISRWFANAGRPLDKEKLRELYS